MSSYTAIKSFDTLDGVPSFFETRVFLGHDICRSQVTERFSAGYCPTALILEGIRGIGKAGFGFQLAWNILNHELTHWESPDFQSSLYRQMTMGGCTNFLYISYKYDEKKGTFQSSITIDTIREIKRFLSLAAGSASWRVLLIDNASSLTYEAENALLKILEEPPERTLFLLVSHGQSGLLPTTQSRCQRLLFRPLSEPVIREGLQLISPSLFSKLTVAEQQQVLAFSTGSMRLALQLASEAGTQLVTQIRAILTADGWSCKEAQVFSESVTQKGALTNYSLACHWLIENLRQQAREAVRQNDYARAEKLSRLSSEVAEHFTQADVYNLDKQQTMLLALEKIYYS